jgi:LVIVD repeat
MRRLARLFVLGAIAALVAPSVAQAGHTTDPSTQNMHPLGHIIEPAVTGGFGGASPNIHTDIAFWGKRAIQGNWNGFNIRDISDPENPTRVSFTDCAGNQGDVLVWDNIVVRSWNTPAGTPGTFGASTSCDGVPVPAGAVPGVGFDGLHVFDISNEANPVLKAQVPLACGSRTATAVPDLENDRLLVYSSSSAHRTRTRTRPPRATGSTSWRCRWTLLRTPASCGPSRACTPATTSASSWAT